MRQAFPVYFTLTFSQLTASAALDLAHASQTSPRSQFANRGLDGREHSSEWPQFTGVPRGPDGLTSRSDRRNVTNPTLGLPSPDDSQSLVAGILSSSSPLLQQLSQGTHSRRGSPPSSLLDTYVHNSRSVPGTPIGFPGSAGTNGSLLKTPGTPLTPDVQGLTGRIGTPNSQLLGDASNELSASLSRIPSAGHDASAMTYNSLQSGGLDEVCGQLLFKACVAQVTVRQYGLETTYGMGGEINPYASYGYEGPQGGINVHGSGGYQAPRYPVGMQRGGVTGPPMDGKMNGLHGPKHKRGDVDRECGSFLLSFNPSFCS